MDPIFFEKPAEMRAWLEEHHAGAPELLVGYYKRGTGKPSITWAESVDQALCFGWIDGVRRRLDDERYTIRFTPRRRGSIWSAVNIKRVAELTAEGLMHPAGLKTFEERDPARAGQYSHERETAALTGDYEQRLRANQAAWDFFQSQPPSYRKTASWWVLSAKREETRLKRLATLIEDSERGERIALVRWARKAG